MLINVCQWHGVTNQGCRHPAILGKSYCEYHYNKVYVELPGNVADRVIDLELKNLLIDEKD